MEKRLLSGNVAEDFHTFFSNMHGMNTGEMVAKIFALFNHIMKSDDERELIAVWRMLDFFQSEVPTEEVHRVKAIRRAILDRTRQLNLSVYYDLRSEQKHG